METSTLDKTFCGPAFLLGLVYARRDAKEVVVQANDFFLQAMPCKYSTVLEFTNLDNYFAWFGSAQYEV